MTRPPASTRTLAYVRARARANMLGSIQIFRLLAPTMNSSTLIMTTGTPTEVYSGPARIYTETQGGAVIVGESVLQTAATTISLPYNAALPKIDDVAVVISFGSDPELEDDAYQIKAVGAGGLIRATRQLQVMAYRANRWWEAS